MSAAPRRHDPAGYALEELAPPRGSAARRVLERDGYEGLTLSRIAAEAGETKSLIVYHFGGKDGLIAALVDSLWHEEDLDLVRRLEDLPDSPADRVRTLIEVHHSLALMAPEFRMYFDLLPNLLRDTRARRSHAELNQTYRSLGVMALRGTRLEPGEQLALASLLLAVDEGFGALLQLDPDGFDHDAAFSELQTITARRTGERAGEAAADEASGGDPARVTADPAGAGAIRATLADPTADLPPVARRLVQGAARLVARDGLAGLTFESVAEASGEPRTATTYYFGDKHSLVVAVHDTLLARAQKLAASRLRGDARRGTGHPLVGMPQRVPETLRTYRTLFQMMPAIMRDEELRARHVAYLAWLRDALAIATAACGLWAGPALIDLTLAVSYGMPIQLLLDRRGLDPAPLVAMWASLLGAPAPRLRSPRP